MRKSSILRLAVYSGIAICAVLIAVYGFFGPGQREQSATDVQLVDGHPLYTAHYFGDTSCSQQGQATSRDSSFGCTLFAAFGNGDRALAGRNFDWDNDPALLLYTRPPDGYASVSLVDVRYLSVSADNALAAAQIAQQLARASSIPFDGMNEYGLFIGMAAVPGSALPYDPAKPTIGSLCAIRIMLDHARNTAEAVELIKKYNIDFAGGPQIHYLLADASGHSAVVEFKDGALSVLENHQPWQAATNFYLTASSDADQQACSRYHDASTLLSTANGVISPEQGMSLLQQTAQFNADYETVWSALYDLHTGDVRIAMSRQYTNTHFFRLDMRE
jgi:hypothetical protein